MKLTDLLFEAAVKHKDLPVQEKSKNASQIRENMSRMATQIIQDTVDDFLMETEMFIDDKYAEVSLPEFKKEWYSITERFENKITNILKNTSTNKVKKR